MTHDLTARWTYPTTIHVGAGKIATLAAHTTALGMKRPLVVTDKGLAGLPMIASIMGQLQEAGLATTLFSDVQGNPTDLNLAAGITAFRAGAHDGVIVVGGGSAMDVGKLVALMEGQTIPVWDLEDVGDWWTRAKADAIHPILAVPTTAGTGSEVGRAALADQHRRPHQEDHLPPENPARAGDRRPRTGPWPAARLDRRHRHGRFYPRFRGLLRRQLSSDGRWHRTGIGAADRRQLPRAVQNGQDLEARTMMFAAAMMGGVAFQKGLRAVHSIAHPLGAIHDIQHGTANAVILPSYVVAFNRPAVEGKIARVAHALKFQAGSGAFQAGFWPSVRHLGIPHTLADLGATIANADEIATQALADPSTAANPRKMSHEDFRRL